MVDRAQYEELERRILEFAELQTTLQESKEKYRLIVDTITYGVQELDVSGKIVYANSAYHKMLGYDDGTLIGRSVFELQPDNHEQKKLYDYIQLIKEQQPEPEPWSGKTARKNGDILDVQTDWDYKRNRQGEVVGFISIISDITDRRKIETALRKSRKELEKKVSERTFALRQTNKLLLYSEKLSAIGSLSASIAHELNNPLYGVKAVLEGVKRRASFDEEDAKLIDMAIDECHRMKDLIKNLQDFNRPTSGRIVPMDIHAVIDNILQLSELNFKKKNLKIKISYVEGMPEIKAVPDQIKQVILTLLNNGVSACRDGDKITINTELVNKKNCVIRICDTGEGIAPEHIDKIFDPFFSTKPTIKGTGLGLSISYGIVKRHGGRIDVASEPDGGSIFTITLPVEGVRNA